MTNPANPQVRLRNPDDLLEAIPYLLGFRPEQSLVVIGVREDGITSVTARVDLSDDLDDLVEPMVDLIRALRYSDAASVAAVVLSEDMPEPDPRARWAELIAMVATVLIDSGLEVMEFLLASRARWWSALCDDLSCCPAAGNPRPAGTSTVECELVHQGVPTRPSREALIAPLDAIDKAAIAIVQPLLDDAERRLATAREAGKLKVVLGRDLALMLAEIRRRTDDPHRRLSYRQLARLAVALRDEQVRDAIWRQVDDRSADVAWVLGDMACRLPDRYRTAPLFLWGWQHWRNGEGLLAKEAVRRVLEVDPDYSAARLVVRALDLGVSPQSMPSLTQLGAL